MSADSKGWQECGPARTLLLCPQECLVGRLALFKLINIPGASAVPCGCSGKSRGNIVQRRREPGTTQMSTVMEQINY